MHKVAASVGANDSRLAKDAEMPAMVFHTSQSLLSALWLTRVTAWPEL